MTPPTRTFRGSKKENFQGSVKHWLEGSVRFGFSNMNQYPDLWHFFCAFLILLPHAATLLPALFAYKQGVLEDLWQCGSKFSFTPHDEYDEADEGYQGYMGYR